MTTSRMPSDYYIIDEYAPKNNAQQFLPKSNYSQDIPTARHGVVTNKTRKGSYNVVEKDYGDHKVIYHIPVEYGDNYDVSKLEDVPAVEEEAKPQQTSSKLVRRRIYHQYKNVNNDDNYEQVEEVPILTSRRHVYAPQTHPRDKQVVTRVYETQPVTETVEYVYDDDYSDIDDYRPDDEEEIEYVVRERVQEPIYMQEPRPVRRIVYVEEPSVPLSSARRVPSPRSPPISYSPRRSPQRYSPETFVTQRSPSPKPAPPIRRHEISPPLSSRKQQTARSPPTFEPSTKSNIPKSNEPPPLRLMDVIAQNRAKRGSRIPKPKREVDEQKVHDPPVYRKNLIKNGFVVHK